MLFFAAERKIFKEKKLSENDKKLNVKMLSHEAAKRLQDAARIKYKKAFAALKDI